MLIDYFRMSVSWHTYRNIAFTIIVVLTYSDGKRRWERGYDGKRQWERPGNEAMMGRGGGNEAMMGRGGGNGLGIYIPHV